jgi:3-oxoacyl-[acyl-carrier protein] reductase
VLVTGGNRGIGLAIAQAFHEAGDKVAVTHRGSGAPDGLFGVRCDVTDEASVDAAFSEVEAEYGPVQVLVSNAGITDDKLLLRMNEQSFTGVLDANLTGAYRVAKRATAGMVKARGGRMVFISSVVALTGAPGQANYAASKAGLIGFTKALAREIGSRNVTVNVVAPGYITTAMTDVLPEKSRQELESVIALRRLGTVDDVAAAVLYLASDEAAYVTGHVLNVSGGMYM